MKRIVVSLIALAVSYTAMAQTSSTTAPAASTTATTTGTQAAPSKWAPSILFLGKAPAVVRDAYNREAGVDGQLFDESATYFDTQTHFNLAYKFENGLTVKATQRLYVSSFVNEEMDYGAALASLRIALSHKLTEKGTITYRFTIPTTDEAYKENNLVAILLMPSFSWEVQPKWTMGMNAYVGGIFYGGNRRSPSSSSKGYVDSRYNTAVYNKAKAQAEAAGYAAQGKAVPEVTQKAADEAVPSKEALLAKRMSQTAAERNILIYNLEANTSYSITDKVSISQSFGYGFSQRNTNSPRLAAEYISVGTELGYQFNKNVGLGVGISQGHATLPDSYDYVGEKALYNVRGFQLYMPEETTYAVSANITF